MVKVSKAIALLLVPDLLQYQPPDVPWLAPFGTKLYVKRRGCVSTYFLAGYAQDGSDIRNALASVQCM
jgi:hypothetical protein